MSNKTRSGDIFDVLRFNFQVVPRSGHDGECHSGNVYFSYHLAGNCVANSYGCKRINLLQQALRRLTRSMLETELCCATRRALSDYSNSAHTHRLLTKQPALALTRPSAPLQEAPSTPPSQYCSLRHDMEVGVGTSC